MQQVAELEKQKYFLYTRAQLKEKVGEEIQGYRSLVQSVRESDNQNLKLKILKTLICLRVEFGSQAQKQMSKWIRVYCEDLGLDLKEGRKTIDGIVSWFKLWITSSWPFNLT